MHDANPVDAFVGARLRQRRMQKGLPLSALSCRTGVSSARLLRFEDGQERIPPDIMIKFCSVLEIAPAYFFEWSPNGETGRRRPVEIARVPSCRFRRRL
ncbi:helix-turn-helix domain-containing protein [Rhodoblastus acidophilus]